MNKTSKHKTQHILPTLRNRFSQKTEILLKIPRYVMEKGKEDFPQGTIFEKKCF